MNAKKEITIEDVELEWVEDSKVDESILNEEICRTASLHSKYTRYYVYFNKKLIEYEIAYSKMGNMKRKYYRGECTQEELQRFKWNQYQGLKVTGVSDMNTTLEYDLDMIKIQEKKLEYSLSVKTVERILNNIGYRDSSLKTLFEYNRYLSGA